MLMLVVLCRKTSLRSELDQLKKEIENQAQNKKDEVSSASVFYVSAEYKITVVLLFDQSKLNLVA